jgi:hypothetical protein
LIVLLTLTVRLLDYLLAHLVDLLNTRSVVLPLAVAKRDILRAVLWDLE